MLEGYGLTESCAATAFNPWDRQKIGTVGQPLPGSVVRIADDGEVLLHGEHLFKEYWNNPGATAEALADGWFHTGDIGTLDEGRLPLDHRAQGRRSSSPPAARASLRPSEDRIRAHALVAECMVVGDGRPFVGALVTIDEEFLGRWCADNGKPAGSTAASLREDPDLLATIQSAIDDGNSAVSKAESVRKFRVLEAQFTEDSWHLTPSLKLKRSVVARITWTSRGDLREVDRAGAPRWGCPLSPGRCRGTLGLVAQFLAPLGGAAPAGVFSSSPPAGPSATSPRPRSGRVSPVLRRSSASPRRVTTRSAVCSRAESPAHHPPRLAVEYRVRRAARVARDHGQAGRGGLQVDDAEALDVEAAPGGSGTAWRSTSPAP